MLSLLPPVPHSSEIDITPVLSSSALLPFAFNIRPKFISTPRLFRKRRNSRLFRNNRCHRIFSSLPLSSRSNIYARGAKARGKRKAVIEKIARYESYRATTLRRCVAMLVPHSTISTPIRERRYGHYVAFTRCLPEDDRC